MQVAMAKSEIPSIVVHPGIGGCSGGSVSEGAMSERPRLAKQEEVDMEEDNFLAPSPITIHIQGERDGFSDKLEEEESLGDTDQSALPTTSAAECSPGGSDSDSRAAEKAGPRSHGKGGTKKQLGKQGSSQGSQDGSSPSLSRDSSTETYTDSTGIDLQQFIVDTLHKSQKDRAMLLKIEQDLYTLVKDNKCQVFKFTPMSSYNRMLVHRVSAFFGMEHNIDKPGTSVIVNKTKNTRLPDVRFSEYIRDELVPEEPKKLILKRDSASFEEGKESPERQSSMDSRRSKSFEEREEEYEKARARIFNQDEGYGESPYSLRSQEGTLNSSRRSSQEDLRAWTGEPRPWSSTDSDSSSRKANSFEMESGPVAGNSGPISRSADSSPAGAGASEPVGNRGANSSSNSSGLLHPNQGLNAGGATSGSSEGRPSLIKASSFGGITLLTRDNSSNTLPAGGKASHSHPARLTKAESLNETSGRPLSQLPQLTACEGMGEQVLASQEVEAHPAAARASPLSPAQPNLSASQEALSYGLENSGHPSLTDKNSSQACQWEVQGVLKEDGLAGAAPSDPQGAASISVNAGTALWPVASVDSIPPGSVLLNPTLTTSPYFGGPDTMVYQAKALSPTQAYVVTPIHALKGPLLPPPSSANINGKGMVGNPGSPHQGNPSQLGAIPVSQYGAVVYIPCVASHVAPGTMIGPQGSASTSAPSTTLQLITAHQQQQQQAGEHRPNQAVMPDLVSQLSALTLTPPPPPQPPPPQSAPATCEMASYLVPAASGDLVTKLQPPVSSSSLKAQPAALTTQVPLYYMPQSPTGVFNGVRYMCPGGPPMILHGQPSSVAGPSPSATTATPACCIKSPEGVPTPDNTHAQSTSPHLVGHPQAVYPGYTFLGFPHQSLEAGILHQVPTTAAAATLQPYNFQATPSLGSNGPSPSTPMTSGHTSLPVYPYNSGGSSGVLLNGAIPHNSSQPQQQAQHHQPQQQQFFGQQSPVCMVGSNGNSYTQSQYRPVAPNVLQGISGGTSGAPANAAPYLSYTIYSPQNTNYNSLPSSFLHVLRPNFPATLSGLRNSTPPTSSNLQHQHHQQQAQSFQGVPVQFTTASALPNHSMSSVATVPQSHFSRGKIILPAKQELNLKDAFGNSEIKFSGGVPRIHLSAAAAGPSICMPPQSAPLYRQALPLLPDVRLLGRPLHQAQQLNSALLLAQQQQQHQQQQQQQQHPRFASHHPPHQSQQPQQYSMGPVMQVASLNRGISMGLAGCRGGGNTSAGGGGGRKGRNRTPTHKSPSSSSLTTDGSHSTMETPNAGSPLVLEVDGTPQGLRRSELERYLEPLVASYGAKIQVLNGGGGTEANLQGGDGLLTTPCKHQVLAVFETEAAAQSALLNFKTSKFQLRSCAPCRHAKS